MDKSLRSPRFLAPMIVFSSVYLIFVTLLMNTNLVRNTISGSYGFDYKIKILLSLIQGMWTAMSGTGFFLLLATALLTGANLSLLTLKIKSLKKHGNLRLVAGGSSLLGLAGSGCAACGLPILALLGLGGSVAFLPLRGMELSYLSVLLLVISFYILAKTPTQKSCNINNH